MILATANGGFGERTLAVLSPGAWGQSHQQASGWSGNFVRNARTTPCLQVSEKLINRDLGEDAYSDFDKGFSLKLVCI